jgi:hypothetical protein
MTLPLPDPDIQTGPWDEVKDGVQRNFDALAGAIVGTGGHQYDIRVGVAVVTFTAFHASPTVVVSHGLGKAPVVVIPANSYKSGIVAVTGHVEDGTATTTTFNIFGMPEFGVDRLDGSRSAKGRLDGYSTYHVRVRGRSGVREGHEPEEADCVGGGLGNSIQSSLANRAGRSRRRRRPRRCSGWAGVKCGGFVVVAGRPVVRPADRRARQDEGRHARGLTGSAAPACSATATPPPTTLTAGAGVGV